jgi:hypothetical protein
VLSFGFFLNSFAIKLWCGAFLTCMCMELEENDEQDWFTMETLGMFKCELIKKVASMEVLKLVVQSICKRTKCLVKGTFIKIIL